MSLLEKINFAFQKKTQTAKEKYIAALRNGDDALILPAAEAAGITAEKIQADAAIIDRAAELRIEVEKFAGLEKKNAAAALASKAAEDELERTIVPLQEKARVAAWHAAEAETAFRACRAKVNALRGLYEGYSELLPRDDAPACIREKWKSESQQQTVDKSKRDALSAFSKSRDAVATARLQRQQIAMGRLPQNCLISDPDNFGRDPELRNKIQAVVEKCEAELDAARTAAIKTGISANELDSIIFRLPA
jgi:hypothetical protein